MAAIEHQHGGAGTLILGLVHVQVFVFEIQRQLDAFALHGAEQSLADVQIHGVAEFVLFGRAGGLDAGGQIARIVRSEARVAQRPEQILQRLEAEKIDALVGDLDVDAAFLLAGAARLLFGVDVAFVDELLDQLAEQLVHLLFAHAFELLPDLLGAFGIEEIALL